MKKFLMVAAVGALALLMAVPASALDFKFSGEYRVRFYAYGNVGFNGEAGSNYQVSAAPGAPATQFVTPTANPRGAQIRIRPRFDVSDDNGNMTAVLRLEIGDIEFGNGGGAMGVANGVNVTPGGARIGNGAGGSLGADGVNVETKWAYMDFALPFGVPGRMRAGIQPWYTPKGILVDDDIAGVRIYGKYNIVSYDLGWYRASGGPQSNALTNINIAGIGGVSATGLPTAAVTVNTTDNNYDYYQFRLDGAFSPAFNAGMYYIYGDNRTVCNVAGASGTINNAGVYANPATCANRIRLSHFFGLTASGKVGTVGYDFDWIYSTMDGGSAGTFGGVGTPVEVKGWGLDAGVHMPIGPVTGHLLFSYATGDKNNGGSSEAFGYIAPSWNGAGGMYEMIGASGAFDPVELSQDMMTNLWMVGLGVEYRPVKALWLRMMYGYAGFTSKAGNGAGAYGPLYPGKASDPMTGKSNLGQEISFRADYDLWTGFKIQGAAGWLIPSAGDVAQEYILQLLYNF